MTQNLLPLEKVFERKAADHSSFHQVSTDYVTQYKNIVGHLRKDFYGKIDVGLAANSDTHGIFTFHDGDHFDEVVRFAGYLLGVKDGTEDVALSAYEIYILLVAIRIHDVGNIRGRQNHEKQCFEILREMQAVSGSDVSEKKLIANIAQAHGGKTLGGSKDTIGGLPERQSIAGGVVRHRLLASILRFADEACENKSRALRQAQIPEQNQIYHVYAGSISDNTYSASQRRLNMLYEIQIDEVAKEWGRSLSGETVQKIHLPDYILERLTKMDQERRYCNKFSRELYTVDEIRASINIIDKNHETVMEFIVPVLMDAGYPEDDPNNLKEQLKHICGEHLAKYLKEGGGNDK